MKQEYLERAKLIGNWFVNTQVPVYPRASADEGRFWYHYNVRHNGGGRSTSWTTAVSLMSLLSLYYATKEEKYKKAALNAGKYLKTLQILDNRIKSDFGAIREHTPQTDWLYPRDAITGAWGFLCLYFETKDKDYLERAEIFANWYLKYCKDKEKWTIWKYYLGNVDWKKKEDADNEKWYWQGGFQAGAGVFFYHLYLTTKKEKYLTLGLKPLADGFLKKFLKLDGSLYISFDPVTKKYLDADYTMHMFNDDFSCLALLCSYQAFKDEKYLQGVLKFANWLYHQQKENGCFSNFPASQATAIILFCNLNKIKPVPHLIKSAKKSSEYIFTQQELNDLNPNVYGGLYGENGGKYDDTKREYIAARYSSYAISALLMLNNPKNQSFFSLMEE